MTSGFQPLHPRKLYSMLRSCPSLEARAHAALEFLCGCAGSTRGMLFIAQNGRLSCLARTPSLTSTPDLVAEVERIWSRQEELQPDDSRTRTIDLQARRKPESDAEAEQFMSALGVAFERRLLATGRAMRFIPVGVVMLEQCTQIDQLRHAYIESICNAFLDAGDVSEPVDPKLNP
jgi:transcriptional regulator of met regulon